MKKRVEFLPPHEGETDEEVRLRESINRQAGKLLTTLDAAMALRTAPSDAAQARHNARSSLTEFARYAREAHSKALDARGRRRA